VGRHDVELLSSSMKTQPVCKPNCVTEVHRGAWGQVWCPSRSFQGSKRGGLSV